MMDWVGDVLNARATVDGLLLLIGGFLIFSFIKGWLLTPSQVRNLMEVQNLRLVESNKRGDDWKAAYDQQSTALNLALDQIEKLKVVGEATNKVLTSLPVRPAGETEGAPK